MTQLESFRASKDQFLASQPESPLAPEQKQDFHGLCYFPENPDLRLEATIEELPQKEEIKMQTSTGDVQTYIRFGVFKFTVDGQEAQLTIYSGPHSFFLPFVDFAKPQTE